MGDQPTVQASELTPRPLTEGHLDVQLILNRFAAIENRLDRGSDRMGRIESDLRTNTAATQAQTETLGEVRDLLELGRAGFRFLSWFGTAARWLGGLGTAALAIWGAIYTVTHGGTPPGK